VVCKVCLFYILIQSSAIVSLLRIRSFATAGYSYINLQVFTLMIFAFVVEVSLFASLQFQISLSVVERIPLPAYTTLGYDDSDDEGIEMQEEGKFVVRMNIV
jgi:hypothetical protein